MEGAENMSTLKIINGEKIFCGNNTRYSKYVNERDLPRMERLRQMAAELTAQGRNIVLYRQGGCFAIFCNGVESKPVTVGRAVSKNVRFEAA